MSHLLDIFFSLEFVFDALFLAISIEERLEDLYFPEDESIGLYLNTMSLKMSNIWKPARGVHCQKGSFRAQPRKRNGPKTQKVGFEVKKIHLYIWYVESGKLLM